ncbi:hypothetical protein [Streptomyces sp. NPDC048172]|uniref:hypothetical protein n=1 Tax=Streptomyces sp. NPDC048172 TaxID=3365505 RepID=UPI003712E8CB
MLRAIASGPQHPAQLSWSAVQAYGAQPQLDVLVLHPQQLEVEQDEQLEQLHEELLAAISIDGSLISSISKVVASSSRSSRSSAVVLGMVLSCSLRGAVDRRSGGAWHGSPLLRVVSPPPAGQPPHPVLVLVEQQLDVEQDEQLEHEQLELHQPAASWPMSVMSSTSKVAVSSESSSSLRPIGNLLPWLGSTAARTGGGARASTAQLVLLQLQLEQPQQLEVEQDEQLEVLVLELHQPAASWPMSEISSTSKLTVSSSSSSVVSDVAVTVPPRGRGR